MNYIIKNVKILDYQQEMFVYTKNGIIEKISTGYNNISKNYIEIDGKNKYLFPGFIDFHTHLFKDGSEFGIEADRLFDSGVICAVDMGTAGHIAYPSFHKCNIATQKMEIKSFINVSPVGQLGSGINEPLDFNLLDESKIKKILETYNEIVGIKLRLSKSIVKELGEKPLIQSLEIAEKLNLPLCIHTTDPPISFGRIASLMRKGDIITHIYQNKGKNLFKDNENIEKNMIESQKRGVIMDVGNGKFNFDFNVAKKAIELGFLPDIISSDTTNNNYHKTKIMWDLPFVMSKFMALGLSLQQVVDMVTIAPAKILKIDDRIGEIKEGYEAKLVLCNILEKEVEFQDAEGNILKGNKLIKPIKLIYGNEIIECKDF
ncbi:MAG: amidohydrolase family protein [Fusobacterium gastrosuis]|uniref:amidohydrolase family protein n=1 Tax=Fusobacterium gastrosuis TaxID=1755100 RepID=UPI002A8C678E|nr:amidohydrolase family protein [Fusobacterium gastrosuis]